MNDLRHKFENGLDEDLEILKSEIIKKREKELISQLKEFKNREKELIIKREENETKLADKLSTFNQTKEKEMKTKLERERLKKILKNADMSSLDIINQKKQKKLNN